MADLTRRSLFGVAAGAGSLAIIGPVAAEAYVTKVVSVDVSQYLHPHQAWQITSIENRPAIEFEVVG